MGEKPEKVDVKWNHQKQARNVRPKKHTGQQGVILHICYLAMTGSELSYRNFNPKVTWRIVWKHYNVPAKDKTL